MPVLYSSNGTPVQYATAAEFATWLDPRPAPANPDPLLRHASRIVTHAVRGAVAVDEFGLPTDAQHAATLRDAATAQAETMIDAYGGGGSAQSVDGVILNTEATGDTFSAWPVADEALRILRTGGLLNAVVSVR